MRIMIVWVVAAGLFGCRSRDNQPSSHKVATVAPKSLVATGGSNGSGSASGSAAPVDSTPPVAISSTAVLARTNVATSASVKHVLISWKGLVSSWDYQDPRGANRTNADAAKLAQQFLAQLTTDPSKIDELIAKYSEDPNSKFSTEPYEITRDTPTFAEFKQLALRLAVNEAGIVQTKFGYDIIERVAPSPPDPLESAQILARKPIPGEAVVEHVLISWSNAPGASSMPARPTRSKADADKLAQDVLAKAAHGDFAKLMKDYSDDPVAKDTAHTYTVETGADQIPFAKIAVRLQVGEVGLVRSVFGWHVVKRLPTPPADPLLSADIMKRDPVTEKSRVKHILLGWNEHHGGDPRGLNRDRATLEKLVHDTVAKLRAGDKIEPLMKDLSEDPGSAATGTAYDVTPDAGLVPTFKTLALRLKVGEVGVTKTQFGIHIVQRVE